MGKINQEEYIILKGLDDRWKWITRDRDIRGEVEDELWVYECKPERHSDFWRVGGEGEMGEVIAFPFGDLFQFIQWEDEEPYNIQELIEEYEYSAEHVSYVVNERVKALGKAWSESEETEVKSKQELIEKWESAIESAEYYGKGKEERLISYMKDFVSDLNQVDNLQNIIVPKQEEIRVPEWFAEWFGGRGYEMSLYGIFNDLYTNNKSKMEEWSKQYEMGHAELQNDIASIKLQGKGIYEVEEEQKFYVLNSEGETMIRKNDSGVRTSSGFKIRNGFEGENYKFTEQEIKDYDDRYIPFMVPVEEMKE